MHYYLDPELVTAATAMPQLDLADLENARAISGEVLKHLPVYEAEHPIVVTELAISGQAGEPDVACRLYVPAERSGPVPVLLYLFGGAYCMGSISMLDSPARATVDDRLQTHSIRTLVDVPMWQPRNSPYSWRYYLRGTAEPGDADVPLYAAPGRARIADLVGLQPAFVATYQVDPTRDEGLRYAQTLIQAGVPTDLHNYAGAFHVAHIVSGTVIGARMLADRIEAIQRLLVGTG
jgi:acetyl esterase/lipase